jgi:hypothetical protein
MFTCVSSGAACGGACGGYVTPALWLPAARRAGLEFVEKVLTTKLTSTDTTERTPCFASRPVVSLVELASGPYLTWFDGTAG